ncbi:MAG TPA: hypothetical protein VGK06_07995 [Methanosarcina sp.]|jgi:hypothetical protein
MEKTFGRSKKMLGVLIIICFLFSVTAVAASAQDPVISNERNGDPNGNAVSNKQVDSGSDCTHGSGGCPWRNLNPNDNKS